MADSGAITRYLYLGLKWGFELPASAAKPRILPDLNFIEIDVRQTLGMVDPN